MPDQFAGDNPYVLIVVTSDETALIDLDETGWAKRYGHLMRAPGRWILGRKTDSTPILTLAVSDGEQPYYTSHVVGVALLPPPDALGMTTSQALDLRSRSEIRAYGIGKKRLDGHVDRMWILPSGAICTGDDVDVLGEEIAKVRLMDLLRKGRKHAQTTAEPLPQPTHPV